MKKNEVWSRWLFALQYSERSRARAGAEGSTCPPRGKIWLVVYCAHAISTERSTITDHAHEWVARITHEQRRTLSSKDCCACRPQLACAKLEIVACTQ